MREFVYFSRKAQTKGNFKDLMQAGRMDIACHMIVHSFFVSNARRNKVGLHLFFYGPPDPPKHLEIWSEKGGKESPISKKDAAGLIKRMLFKYKPGKKYEALPACFVEKQSIIKFVEERVKQERPIYLLDQKGEDIRHVHIDSNPVFVMGDHEGIPSKERKRLKKMATLISMGKVTYFASQTMAVLQNELDRRELY